MKKVLSGILSICPVAVAVLAVTSTASFAQNYNRDAAEDSVSASALDCNILVPPNILSEHELQILVSKGFNPVKVDRLIPNHLGHLAIHQYLKQTMSNEKFYAYATELGRMVARGEDIGSLKSPFIKVTQVIQMVDYLAFTRKADRQDFTVLG